MMLENGQGGSMFTFSIAFGGFRISENGQRGEALLPAQLERESKCPRMAGAPVDRLHVRTWPMPR